MQAPVLHKIHHQHFWLSAERAVFWQEQQTLILSDLHLGKSGHFRKAGIPVPQQVMKENMQRLLNLIQYFKPNKIIAVGDLFHSAENLELELFKKWRYDFEHIDFFLVKGNHDILKRKWYEEAEINLIDDRLIIDLFSFTHDQCDASEDLYSFCGHLHPGIVINGIGKQSLRFPCFYFTPTYCILPAFGKFTGLANIRHSKEDSVYAVVDKALIPIKG
ncbi:MAG: ligase-associated DNA damage response endonuclease PdeM [Flavisolibacter sp.]|nr:ligase-associated DNA damage response endonuclease PdeM [Flavisolibacter sp.]